VGEGDTESIRSRYDDEAIAKTPFCRIPF
jgi:hypothetical protein